jgi:predicted dehydrogenase
MIKIGIIGGGAIAQVHARMIASQNRSRVIALAELKPAVRKDYSQKYGIETFQDYEKMLQEINLDAVVVCLPHYLHLQAAKAAMEAGAHVLLEKPMEISVERCDELIECSQKYRKKLFIGHILLKAVRNGLRKKAKQVAEF